MTDEQKDALEWLDGFDVGTISDRHARTIKAMLAEPRLPKEPPHWEVLASMMRALNEAPDGDWVRKWEAAYRALYAHLAPRPKRKMIRIRAKGVDMLVEPPVSQSEVEVDQ